jgi:hypothetical protein
LTACGPKDIDLPPIATDRAPEVVAMTLPYLATFIDTLIDPKTGLDKRKEFNTDGFKTFVTKVKGKQLEAFLSFEKRRVGAAVILEAPKDWDAFATEAKDYAQWLERMGLFAWPESDEVNYPNGCGGPAGTYGYPVVHLRNALVVATTPIGNARKVKLEIRGEGFLPGCTVEIYGGANLDEKKAEKTIANLDDCSTFRFARITTEIELPSPGDYRAQVVDDLDGGVKLTIGGLGAGAFKVA